MILSKFMGPVPHIYMSLDKQHVMPSLCPWKHKHTHANIQVLKATANPSHAFSKFGSGNYETLRPRPEEGVDTRESLVSQGLLLAGF